MDIKLKKVLTPMFRVSFPSLDEPQSYKGQPPKYKITMLFDKKTTDMKGINAAIKNATIEKFGSDPARWPKSLKKPIRDGDMKDDVNGYAGHWFITATSKSKPGLVDYPDRNPILEKNALYAGSYARAELIAFYYDAEGNKGISFSLQNLQKIKDGKPFSGKKSAQEAFADDASFDTSEDDPSNYSDDSSDMGFEV